MAEVVPYAERKRQELRDEIVAAAFDVFSERGYHAAGIADIAQRLGIGHGTFYRHFKNKRDILDHVIDGLIGRALEALTAENAPEATATVAEYRAQVERIASALFSLFDDDPRLMRMLLLQAPGVDAELEERLLEMLRFAAQITARYLENGRARGFLRDDLDVDTTAEAVVGIIVGGTLFALQPGRGEAARERYRQAAVALMFEGVAEGAGAGS